jgi:hypothetical protein
MSFLLVLLMTLPAIGAVCEGAGACCPGATMPASFSASRCCSPVACAVSRPDTRQAAALSAQSLPSTFPAAEPGAPFVLSISAPAGRIRPTLSSSVPLPILHAQLLI